MGAVGAGADNRVNTAHTRPPGFDPASCHLCGWCLRDHAVNEFCRISPAERSQTRATPTPPPSVRDRKEFHIMTKTATWVEQAAKDLGISNEQPCGHCKGKGKIRRPPTKGSIASAVGYTPQGGRQLGNSLADPALSRLQVVAEALGGVSLDEAAAWSKALAKRILEEG